MQKLWSLLSADPVKTVAALVAALVVLNTQLELIPAVVLQQVINVLIVLGVPVAVSAHGKAQAQAKVASAKADTAHERLDQIAPTTLPLRSPTNWPS